jgi:hypothetical protein
MTGAMPMGVRESLEKNKPLAVGFAVVFIAAAIGLMVWSNRSGMPAPLKQAYYSDDDGKTFFSDDINRVYPFDHSGKQAYRAYVFRAGGGKPFVGYLAGLTDKGRKQLEGLRAKANDGEAVQAINQLMETEMLVKKPGGTKWVLTNSPEAAAIMNVAAAPGQNGQLAAVYP